MSAPDRGHCKSLTHLRVLAVTPGKNDSDGSDVVATHESSMPCQANAPQNGPGVLLTDSEHKSGLKLLPDAAAALPHLLRAAASQGHSVQFEHTGGRIYSTWAIWTTEGAQKVADLIAAAT